MYGSIHRGENSKKQQKHERKRKRYSSRKFVLITASRGEEQTRYGQEDAPKRGGWNYRGVVHLHQRTTMGLEGVRGVVRSGPSSVCRPVQAAMGSMVRSASNVDTSPTASSVSGA